jgi:hypothetical protein
MTTNNKTSARAIDEPLEEPEGDLLDMDQHARALANYIRQDRKLPFTVGIFGEWGEGKTTMVNFLKRHLMAQRPLPAEGPPAPLNFVKFTAWPYTTSEKLWRALILAIAKELYHVDPEQEEREETEKRKPDSNIPRPDLIGKLTGFLHGDLFRKKEPPPKLSEYKKLVQELDRVDYGKISKRTPKDQLDQEEVMSAVVSGALSVLGTVSPLAAGIRSFIGGEPKLNSGSPGEGVEDDQPSAEMEALPRFQKIFREILEAKAGKDPVYVFIDDLDRAQPDVALDIMESIRIALSEGDCVYIVAVDQRLIEQGLRLRYRDLFENEAERDIETKGQEYLEKIIQFRTRVPQRTPEQTQRLIAAEFPHWTPAGDIIQSIVGNNPRRVKQYCQRLSFQNMIGTPFTVGSGPVDENVREQSSVQEAEATVSELKDLSRYLRPPGFPEEKIQELFVELSESYGAFQGTPLEKLQALLKKYETNLDVVRDAVDVITPSLLPVRNKRP